MRAVKTMKVIGVVALALTAASPALAKHRRHAYPLPPPYAAAAPAYGYYDTYTWGPDPQGVYVLGQKVGRDPDPNIRQQLYNDYWWLYWGR
jgi:hypothetical protein